MHFNRNLANILAVGGFLEQIPPLAVLRHYQHPVLAPGS